MIPARIWNGCGVALLLLPLVPGIGLNINGSRIWARFGPISFQPGEMAKLSLAIFFASYLVEKRELLGIAGRRFAGITFPDLRHIGPLLLAWAVSLVVMLVLSGFQLLMLGVLGEYLWRVADEVRGAPAFIIEATLGIDETNRSGAWVAHVQVGE